jgi:UDP-N-acetylglucosamine/UDP-N-acetylgalactosamine diphosphorylase
VASAGPDIRALRARFEEFDQKHVLRFWDRLDLDAQRRLAEQAAGLDLPALLRGFRSTQRAQVASGKLEPQTVEALPERGGDRARWAEARERGGRCCAGRAADGRVRQGSRLGFEDPRACFRSARSAAARCSRCRRSGSGGCASGWARQSPGT